MPREVFGPQRQYGQRDQQRELEEWRKPSPAESKIVHEGQLQAHDGRERSAHEPTVESLWMCVAVQTAAAPYGSNAKMRFQSLFMLITTQFFFCASS